MINKLDKAEAPALHRSLVLDENDSLHSFRAFLAGTGRRHHCLCDCLGSGERIETAKEKHRCLRTANIARAVIRVLRAAHTVARVRALRVVDLHPPPIVWGARFKGRVERRRSRRAVRRRRRDLHEREVRVDKLARGVDARELREAETLGGTFEDRRSGRADVNDAVRQEYAERAYVPVVRSRIIVTDSRVPPWAVR